MIEQTVKIVAVEGNDAWIESLSLHGCERCEAGEGCGGGVFAKLFGDKQFRMKILNTLELEQGENVVIGIENSAVTSASLLSYLLPLMGLTLGAIVGNYFDLQNSEFWTLLLALVGISVSFGFAKTYLNSASFKKKYTPKMLHKKLIVNKVEPSTP